MELVGGELRQPALSFAPNAPQRMTIGGHEIDLAGGRFGERLAWLTTQRIAVAAGSFFVVVGAVIRFWGYNAVSMWLDEGFALLYSKQSWPSVMGINGFYSPHPPLYFTLTKVFNLVFADDSAGRTLSVFCGIAALPVFWLLARRLLDPLAAIVATAVFAFSPIHIYYSQEARMYSLVVLSVTTSYLALVGYLQTRQRRWAALYGIALVIAAYGDYSSLFALAPQALILLWYLRRSWRQLIPLIIAGGAAVVAYAPWLPTVIKSVNSAGGDERREDYLGAGFRRVLIVAVRITGIASDSSGPYFPSLQASPWDQLPSLDPLFLLAMIPAVVLGIYGLWRRWLPMAVTLSFIGCIAVTAAISVVSPSFAERSVLCASVGWALLLGASFNGRIHRERTPLAALSVLFVLAMSFVTIDNIHSSGIKSRWSDASADLAATQTLEYPIITYSYGEVANALVNAYEPGLLKSQRVITVRDGVLEKTLSNDILPKTGITVSDVTSGKLNELLPTGPENDYVWYVYYHRIGQEQVEQGIRNAGYLPVLQKTYVSPRNQVFLSLYARPGAAAGTPVPGIEPFSNMAAWGIPVAASLVSVSPDGASVTILNQSKFGTSIATQVSTSGAALYMVDADVNTLGSGNEATVQLTCLSATGVALNDQISPTIGRRGALHHRSAIVCPAETEQVKITLRNNSPRDQVWSGVSLGRIGIPDQGDASP